LIPSGADQERAAAALSPFFTPAHDFLVKQTGSGGVPLAFAIARRFVVRAIQFAASSGPAPDRMQDLREHQPFRSPLSGQFSPERCHPISQKLA